MCLSEHCMCTCWGGGGGGGGGRVIASVVVSLLGMAHPLWENISGERDTSVDYSHSGSRG